MDGVSVPVVSGTAQYVANRPGTLTAMAVAFDSLGASALASVSFLVAPLAGDALAPVALITSPGEDTLLYGRVPLLGTASDANLAYYTLSYRDVNAASWVEFTRGTASVTSGTLGYIDATAMQNGVYEIRLLVHDRAGNHTTRVLQVTVAGEKKVGQFTLAFEDLSIPMAGMDLAVTRTYDSRDKFVGDFGVGWTLGLRSLTLHENRNQGEAWTLSRTPGLLPRFSLEETKTHTVTVTLPGGRTQEFVAQPRLFHPYVPSYGVMEYKAKPGTYSRLEPVAVDTFLVLGGELYDANGTLEEPFNPSRYRLTLLDGSYFVLDQDLGGVVESGDAQGNRLEWLAHGIRHNAGNTLSFTRDSLNRITSITDIQGRGVQYRYDVLGNLHEVLDPNGYSTRFRYRPNHYLDEVIEARGIRAARTEYDADGRMVRQINAHGDTMTLLHDLSAQTEAIEDFAGRVTTYTYDDRGHVLSKTDAAGETWTYAYDSVGNLLLTTSPDGATRTSTYDSKGNELTSTDELGSTTARTFDAEGHVLTVTDPLSRTTRYEYDARGNLVKETGPGGIVQSERTYDSRGNVLAEKDALGHVTEHTYNAFGWLTSTTDAEGHSTLFYHDNAGRVTREIDAAGHTTRHAYDAKGNRTRTINALGDTVKTEYNSIDKVVRTTDARGWTTQFVYNALGDKVRDISPDGATLEREYDAAGNVSALLDPLGRRTEMEYDHENRLLRTTFAGGSSVQNVYDARGRRVLTTDANGHTTTYGYDEAGRDTSVTDALGNRTRYEYDAVGRKTALVDALGRRTEYAYDAYDRLTTTTFADNSTRVTAYDLAGRKISETDPEGEVTGFEYDDVGNLTAVVDALNHRTEYTYDANNNRISQKDANNRTTAFMYDNLGRMVRRTYPNQDQERWGYDQAGNAVYHVKGEDSTVYVFDASNREVFRKHFSSGHEVTTSYTLDGKRDTVVDVRGTRTYAYDSRGRLQKETQANGDTLVHDYDAQGNRIRLRTPFGETRYGYDALNRMDSVTSPRNQVTVYHYNPVGNRDSVVHANGTRVGYSYDLLSRLTQVRNWGSAGTLVSRFTYLLNDAGIRTQVTELDGSVVTYAYDALYRLTGETRTGSNPYVRTYGYDNVGNRLYQVKDGDTTAYIYNSRDQLTEEESSGNTLEYGYDAAGRMTSKEEMAGVTRYFWVDNDRLDSISGPGVAVGYTYDAEGRKVKETTPTSVRQFLIDGLLPYGQVILETDGAGDLVTEYVYGLERISQERGGNTHWYLADGQGSVRQLANSSGFVSDTYAYTAFGEPLASTGSTANEFRYVGEQADPNSGFYYLRARWMDPRIDRFISVDPFKGKVGVPLSQHRYHYARVSPISFNDPTGRVFGIAELSVGKVGEGTARVINVTASRNLWGWLLSRRVLGSAVANAYLLSVGWDQAKQRAWLAESQKEKPVRLWHYTNEGGKNGINQDPRHIRRGKSSGYSWYTPQTFTSGAEATDKLATPNELEYGIQLFMWPKLDNLSPWPAEPADPQDWPLPDGSTVHRNGKGLETKSDQIIWLDALGRVPSNWYPLTE